MCGIFGVIGQNNAPSKTLEGLKLLEYRGYDSWGVGAVIQKSKVKSQKLNKILVDKHIGKIGDSILNSKLITHHSEFAFGHTRWATHGGVTDINAHPHLDCKGSIALVHNGIVENYQEIKKSLKNHKFISQTDSEVALHLIEEYRKKYDLQESIRKAFLDFKGLSAFLIAEGSSGTLFAIKNGSPLVIGLSKNGNFIASDTNSLLSYTRKVIYLEDNQMAKIEKQGVEIFDVKTGKKIKSNIQTINWKEETAQKDSFSHFMLKEINEESRVIENTFLNLTQQIESLVSLIRKYNRVYLVGCGSAYFAALLGSYLISKIAKKEVIPVAGSEFDYKEDLLDKTSLVIFLSQSGETIDIIEPLKKIKKEGIKTAALVNVFGSTLYRLVDKRVWLQAGPEISVVSTKAFIAKVSTLNLIAFGLINQVDKGHDLAKKAISSVNKILTTKYLHEYLEPIVKILKDKKHLFIIGRGSSYPVALEAALKFKEAAYIHAEGFSGGELKHGAIALVEKGTPCIIFAPEDETYDSIISNAMEIKARGGYIIGVSSRKNEVFDLFLPYYDCFEMSIIPEIVIAQLLAFYVSIKKGIDPDKPRNLAKSVTVK